MAQHYVEQAVNTPDQMRDQDSREYLALAKQVKTLDLKVGRLERLVDDLKRRVDQLESDAL